MSTIIGEISKTKIPPFGELPTTQNYLLNAYVLFFFSNFEIFSTSAAQFDLVVSFVALHQFRGLSCV